jgi:hypothetical protein
VKHELDGFIVPQALEQQSTRIFLPSEPARVLVFLIEEVDDQVESNACFAPLQPVLRAWTDQKLTQFLQMLSINNAISNKKFSFFHHIHN